MISWELQHRLVVVDLNKKVLKKVVRKQWIIRRKIWKLNENRTRVRLDKRIKELVSTDEPDLWKTFKDGVLKVCDEVCRKNKSRRCRTSNFKGSVCMAVATGCKATHVFLRVALVAGLFGRLRLKSGREGSLKMGFCVSGHSNSSVFLHYLSGVRSKIIC